MKNNHNIKLKTYDDIFNVIEKLPENDIKNIDINMLEDFRDHPFKITENKELDELCESIKENGVLVPVIVRPLEEKYEIISGHRRKYCAAKVGAKTIPCIIKEMGYDEAVFVMLDSNIQRKNILPSEKAFSYKIKLNAIRRQGERGDLTSRQLVGKLDGESADHIGKDFNDSGRNVQRYIRLTELMPFLLEAVDKKKLSFGAGIELSYISKEEQEILKAVIAEFNRYPSLAQAKDIRQMSGNLNEDNIKIALFGNTKTIGGEIPGTEQISLYSGNEWGKSKNNETINLNKIRTFFPEHFSGNDIEMAIIEILKKYK